MAKFKTGLNYYSVDTDRYQNLKIKRLRKKFGCTGIAVYDYLLCEIYRDKGCYMEWCDDVQFDTAEYFALTEDVVGEVVAFCASISLFDEEKLKQGILTSRSIQERYIDYCQHAKRKNPTIPKSVFLSEESEILPENSGIIPEECEIIPEESEILPENSGRLPRRKRKEENIIERIESIYPPPQTPPPYGGVVSSSGRGGGRDLKNIYDGLCKSCSEREDVWEAVALSNFFMNDKAANYEEWLSLSPEQRKGYPLYQLNNAIRAQSPPIDTQPYHALCWCKDTCLDAEWREIYRLSLIHADELPKLVKECKKGKINLPGKFIISRLKAQ